MIAASRIVLGESRSGMVCESNLGLSVLRMIDDVGPDSAENLWFELGYFDRSECSDDRDRLAAFQWRVGQAMTPSTSFQTNYSLSAEDNYKAFAAAVVEWSRNIGSDLEEAGYLLSVKMNLLEGLLVTAASRRAAQQSGHLPTWVPDWRISPSGKWRWSYGRIPLSTPESNLDLEMWQRHIRIVAWVAKNDSVRIQCDWSLQIKTYELATLNISTRDSSVQDNDIVLLNVFESDPILGFRHDHDRESILLRANKDDSAKVHIVAANPDVMVERQGTLRSAFGVDKSPSGVSYSYIWADISKYGNVQSHQTEVIPHLGVPPKNVVYYKPMRAMSYIFIV
jgi:hypothetical protein